ncbi:DNA translocase FtsK 4TM domain-containing protein [Paraeggerthella hongkongensis]|uniref:FtsK/SpoIIIE family DNA translocase n=1 Tax=Paraeggerthella hominis TaxID=2897351 RepID=UPI001C126896|nr:DNA translocase FtsK 4TM domain-containing protein [Paraeggerthella hongkongensis]MCD2432145.1 DNA translocase FtsK 4TM domain-containing protein [Paraeggerthella hominis]
MARNSSTTSKSKAATSKSKGRAASPAEKRGGKNSSSRAKAAADEQRLFDDRVRRDITGVAFAIAGIVLFVTAVLPSDAVVTSFVSSALHLLLGLGAYILPFFLLVVGASFLARFERERVPLRVTVGLVMIFVAVLVLLALFTPESAPDAVDRLFVEAELVSRGGYVGAGIAWVGLRLFGQVISCIIMLGVILAGLIVIGFSLSKLIERVQDARAAAAGEGGDDVLAAPPFARVKRSASSKIPVVPTMGDAFSQGATNVLPKGKKAEKERSSKARRGSQSLATQAIGRVGPAADTAGEAPQTLTRKLGRKHEREADASASMPKPSSGSSTPLAAPRPEDGFELPPMSLLATSKNAKKDVASDVELKETAACLQESLESFQIFAEVVGWVAGPTVTLFKVDLPAGVRVSRITALEDDIALALAAPGVRIFAPIPGTNYVGIEVPNRTRQSVLLGDVIKDAPAGPLQIVIGKDVEGRSIVSDLAKMPHLLIGGTTGSGKSVSINAMIMSILMRATPSEVRFIMIDPKRVEFTPYNGIPHLYVPVVTEPREAASALSWGVAEMERRLKVFSKVGARNIGQYNAKVQAAQAEAERAADAGEEPPANDLGGELPYIVIIIDELADLMMNVGKEVEFSISRIAQLARAAGIHLIVATQRPSTNVVTGLIKANITNRIAFNVASGIDSRVVLDTPGAENLIGLGDLLLSKPEYAKPQRIQGCYVSEDEINAVVDMLKEQGEPEYHSEILQTNLITLGASQPDGSGGSGLSDDPLIWEAADIVVSSGLGSTSNIQRRLKVGYSRAGRIMDMLEEKGVVGPPNGSKPREVLVDAMELETLKAFEANDASGPEE